MTHNRLLSNKSNWPKLAQIPNPAKAMVTTTILIMGIALIGALGQIIVHDIIPTFFSEEMSSENSETEIEEGSRNQAEENTPEGLSSDRGDLFTDLLAEDKESEAPLFYKEEQFVWLLKFSHIHLFGMNMIFIFMGAIAMFLGIDDRKRTWVVVLPFLGVFIDILAMWLKVYISPVFFWLHIPGGGMFISAYMIVSIRAISEMWLTSSTA